MGQAINFDTADDKLKKLYDRAEVGCQKNLRDFDGRRVLVEGGGYEKIWLETQPMGGEMYFHRDPEAARNNVELFMAHARADGRLPGSIALMNGVVTPQFNKFQGFCFPAPALNLYYLMGRDEGYLDALKSALENFDAYLWRARDVRHRGVLESYCVCDTGEDHALRYGDAPFWWEEEAPPTGFASVPMRSMDVTSYSYAARDTLETIARIRGDAPSARKWRAAKARVRDALTRTFFDESRGACFDINADGTRQTILTHNTLRCMYWNALPKRAADAFVKRHLLNPDEFWTPFPLPSVAANDPLFRNNKQNDWSGQSEGLTYQRAPRALENYGWQTLIPKIGRKLFGALFDADFFPQQFDPFTGEPSRIDGAATDYGPTMLSVLEYVTLMHGAPSAYTLTWRGHTYAVESDGARGKITADGRVVRETACGARVVTDCEGRFLREIPLESEDTP